MSLHLRPITPGTAGFAALEAESLRNGFRMLQKLKQAWETGEHCRFGQPGELLAGAFRDERLIGIGGRSRDPNESDPRIGRVRHVYVAEDMRGAGVGRHLLENIKRDAGQYFIVLNLRAPPAAFGFYERLGFLRVEGRETLTHRFIPT